MSRGNPYGLCILSSPYDARQVGGRPLPFFAIFENNDQRTLLLFGEHTTDYPDITLSDLDDIFDQALGEMAAEAHVISYRITYHVALSLWRCGELKTEHFRSGVFVANNQRSLILTTFTLYGVPFEIVWDDEPSFGIRVDNHPEGVNVIVAGQESATAA